ncbi:MAG: YdcF family protein, partial [Patescibacteria group bacterium]
GPQISYEEYPNEAFTKDFLINNMVGDIQRIKEYPAKGFQIPQEIPDEVWAAFEELVRRGFTKLLIQE